MLKNRSRNSSSNNVRFSDDVSEVSTSKFLKYQNNYRGLLKVGVKSALGKLRYRIFLRVLIIL